MKKDNLHLILPAAGVGSRMQADRPKQYLKLLGKTILEHTLDSMLDFHSNDKTLQALGFNRFSKVVLVVSSNDPYWQELSQLEKYQNEPRLVVAPGGAERCDSVLNGLLALESHVEGIINNNEQWVAVHDVARPCVQHSDIEKLLLESCECFDEEARIEEQSVENGRDEKESTGSSEAAFSGALLAAPVRDTMKRGFVRSDLSKSGASNVFETVEREQLWHALTPQLFPFPILNQALTKALQDGFKVTDEASAVEYISGHPKLVVGRADNIKVTRPEDLELAEFFLNR